MATYFNEEKWNTLVTSRPDWYLELAPQLKELWGKRNKLDAEAYKILKKEVYGFFERHLKAGTVVLGDTGEEYDSERECIDTVVLHHSHNQPGLTLHRLNAIHFVNLYMTHYAKPRYENEGHIKGDPIWSGHFRDGKQVFYAYHWLVRMDGTAERLLKDEEIGWQAGNWDVNKRSVAVCLDNDYTDTDPEPRVLGAVADLMRKHYSHVPTKKVIGHREVNQSTECPGNGFLGGWKEELLTLLKG